MVFKKLVLVLVIVLSVFSQQCFADESAEKTFSLAHGAYSDGLYEIAEGQFEKFIKKYPEDENLPRARLLLAECLFQQGQFQKAREEFRQAEKFAGVSEQAFYGVAKSLYGEGRYEESVEAFERFLKNFAGAESAPSAHYRLAEALVRQDKLQEACSVYKTLIERWHDSPYAVHSLFSSGVCFLGMGKFEDSTDAFRSLIAKYPDSELIIPAKFQLGQSYLLSGQFRKAEGVLKKLLKDAPENEYACRALYVTGLIYFRMKKYERAGESFEKCISSFPENRYAHRAEYMTALVHESTGDLGNAVKGYRVLLEKTAGGETESAALYGLGVCLMKLGKEKEGALALKKLSQAYPKSEWAEKSRYLIGYRDANTFFLEGDFENAGSEYGKLAEAKCEISWRGKAAFYKAYCLFKSQKYRDAIHAFKKFIDRFPESTMVPAVNCCLGQAFLELGKHKVARGFFAKLEDKNMSYMKLGDCFAAEGMADKAKRNYKRVEGGYAGAAKFKLAGILYEEKEFAEAAGILESLACDEDSDISDKAHYWLGSCMVEMEKGEQAIKCYSEFIEKFPSSRLLPAAVFNLGSVECEEKLYDESLESYRKLRELFPDSVEARESFFMSGLCQLHVGNSADAETMFSKYLSGCPEGSKANEAGLWLGKHFFGKGKIAEARQMFLKLVESPAEGTLADARYWLGRCYQQEEDYPSALKTFERIAANFPAYRNAEVKLRTGNVKAAMGRDEEALEIYEGIIENEEGEIVRRARLASAETFQKLGRYRQAIGAFEELERIENERCEAVVQFRIASCYEKIGEFGEAVFQYLKVVYLYPEYEELVFDARKSAAGCFEKQGKTGQALNLYRKIVKDDPGGVKGEMARQRIEKITEVEND